MRALRESGGTVRTFLTAHGDVVVSLVLLVITATDMATRRLQPGQHHNDALGYLLVAGIALPYALHRRAPFACVSVALSLLVIYSLFPYGAYPGLNAFALLFGVAAHSDRRRSLAALVATVSALTIAISAQPDGISTSSTWVATELACAVAWLAGDNVRQRRARSAALLERAELLERELDNQARRAIADERLRIARELHDVIAHSMSVIAVQSGMGHHVIATQPEQADRALAAIETISRGALTEMRRMLAMLRDDGEQNDPRTPTPGLGDVAHLVSQVRDAGVHVRVSVDGQRSTLPPGLNLSAYRIVQEALTNVIKHGGSTADVAICYSPDTLRLEIVDDGRSGFSVAWGQPTAGGHGLIGMRERVAVYGGELSAEPRPGGGFRVAVCLPLEAAVPS